MPEQLGAQLFQRAPGRHLRGEPVFCREEERPEQPRAKQSADPLIDVLVAPEGRSAACLMNGERPCGEPAPCLAPAPDRGRRHAQRVEKTERLVLVGGKEQVAPRADR